MPKTIIIFANCHDPDALGDFQTGGKLARDLIAMFNRSGDTDHEVILTTVSARMGHYKTLYGATSLNGEVDIDGTKVKVEALEDLALRKAKVTNYIEANRCQPAPSHLLKEILLPEMTPYFIMGPHQPDFRATKKHTESFQEQILMKSQPELYKYFKSPVIASLGIGGNRIGLTSLKKASELRDLKVEELAALPTYTDGAFGFCYFNSKSGDVAKILTQFISLTGHKQYMAVGKYASEARQVARTLPFRVTFKVEGYTKSTVDNGLEALEFFHTNRMDNVPMRHEMGKSGPVIAVPGMASLIESLLAGKVVYFQYDDLNGGFVGSYNIALRQYLSTTMLSRMLSSTTCLEAHDLAMTLMEKPKPLSSSDVVRVSKAMKKSTVMDVLAVANRSIIESAQGNVARQLLPFIKATRKITALESQLEEALKTLKNPSEVSLPGYEKALRRACHKGMLFEVRVILKHRGSKGFNIDGVAAALCTPLHYASNGGHEAIVRLLLSEGADYTLEDNKGNVPKFYAKASSCQQIFDDAPLLNCLYSLRKKGEDTSPGYEQALRRACAWGRIDDVRTLLAYQGDKGININGVAAAGRTALHFAAKEGHADIVALLLSKGADVSLKDIKGNLAIDLTEDLAIRELLTPRISVDEVPYGSTSHFTLM